MCRNWDTNNTYMNQFLCTLVRTNHISSHNFIMLEVSMHETLTLWSMPNTETKTGLFDTILTHDLVAMLNAQSRSRLCLLTYFII